MSGIHSRSGANDRRPVNGPDRAKPLPWRTWISTTALAIAVVATLLYGLFAISTRLVPADHSNQIEGGAAQQRLRDLLRTHLDVAFENEGLTTHAGVSAGGGMRGKESVAFVVHGGPNALLSLKDRIIKSSCIVEHGWELDDRDQLLTLGPSPRPSWWRPDEARTPDVLVLRRGSGFYFVFDTEQRRVYVYFWRS